MRAYYHENNSSQKPSPRGFTLIGQLALEAGEYAVWAKLSVSVPLFQLEPGPKSPYGAGAAILVYGDGTDQTYVGVKFADGENCDTVNLMTVGKSDRARRARLYFVNLSLLQDVYIHYVRMTALQVEIASQQIVGEDLTSVPEDWEDVAERMRESMWSGRIRDMVRYLPDDD